jgi:hypothetical protein
MMLPALIPILSTIGSQVAKSLFPDPADELKRQQVQNEVQLAAMAQSKAIEEAAAGIIRAEAQSNHWLAANWRPILMLTFGGLIVARWLGWAAPNLAEAEYLALWDIVELGLGGYVIGRSAEKIAPSIADAIKKGKA